MHKEGQPLWSIELLESPDREDVWERAINRRNAEKLFAYLSPPTPLGVEAAPSSGARVAKDLGVEFVQALANWIAGELTTCVCPVSAVNFGTKVKPPKVKARKLPQARVKLLKELFVQVSDAEHRLKDADGSESTYTLAELISPRLLDELEVPHFTPEEVATKKARPPAKAGPPGRPRDALGEREARREAARTPEGEEATGGPDEGPDEGA